MHDAIMDLCWQKKRKGKAKSCEWLFVQSDPFVGLSLLNISQVLFEKWLNCKDVWTPLLNPLYSFIYFVALGIKARRSPTLGKCSITNHFHIPRISRNVNFLKNPQTSSGAEGITVRIRIELSDMGV